MNEAASVDWTTALLVLASGLVLGTILVWRVFGRSRDVAPKAAAHDNEALELRDLEGKCTALVGQLRELDDTASKRTAEQLARERYALELQAAQALLALDAHGARPTLAASTSAPPPSATAATAAVGAANPKHAEMRGFLWGTLSAGSLGLLFFFLYTQARPREAGGSLTGEPGGAGMTRGGGSAGPAAGPAGEGAEEAQIRAAIERNPNDVDAHLDLARVLLARQDMMGVWNETKLVLERSPGHPRALSYQALVRLAMGQGDKAEATLKESLAKDPNLIDTYVHLALVYVKLGRTKDAEGAITEASRRFPDQAAGLKRLLAELEQQGAATADAPPAGSDDPHAGLGLPGGGGAAPPGGPPPERAATSGSGRRVAGSVDLDPALKGSFSPSAVLFVFVREAGFGAGPPIAAKRLPAAAFPVAFEIGESDAMMGQPFPDSLLVEARLDADGDPTTRPPTDPKARQDDVKAGSTDLRLVLKRP